MRFLITLIVIVTTLLVSTFAWSGTKVDMFDETFVANGKWFKSDMRDDGTATIVFLVGLGGDLENNQPLPISAALLTTGLSNSDKAEVAVANNYGLASAVLTAIELTYSYYKETVAGGNIFAAPAIKLTLFASGGTGDNFGTLVYEPSWNQPGGGSQAVPADAWQNLIIDPNTGSGDDASGGWWWTGGFEIPSGAGGPPLRSLAEWAAAFVAADPADFPTAGVVAVSVGVGTFNQGQKGYFDDVTITNTLADACYDFELAGTIPVKETTWGAIKNRYSTREDE